MYIPYIYYIYICVPYNILGKFHIIGTIEWGCSIYLKGLTPYIPFLLVSHLHCPREISPVWPLRLQWHAALWLGTWSDLATARGNMGDLTKKNVVSTHGDLANLPWRFYQETAGHVLVLETILGADHFDPYMEDARYDHPITVSAWQSTRIVPRTVLPVA